MSLQYDESYNWVVKDTRVAEKTEKGANPYTTPTHQYGWQKYILAE